jgi:lysozyme
MQQSDMDLLVVELNRDEGACPDVYFDNASPPNPSIGIGHNLNASPLPAGFVPPLSQDQMNQLLVLDIQTKVINPLNKNLPWWSSLDSVRQRVLANLCFNMGIGGLLEFKNMLAAVQSENYQGAANELKCSKWYGEVGQRAVRLCQAMETGVMPS